MAACALERRKIRLPRQTKPYTGGMVADRRRLRRRFPVRRGGAVRQRGFVPVDARSSCRRRGSRGDVAAGRCAKPGANGGMGIDRCGAAGFGIPAVLPRPRGGYPGARPRHLASLSQGGRAGPESAAGRSPPPAASLCQQGARWNNPLPSSHVLAAVAEDIWSYPVITFKGESIKCELRRPFVSCLEHSR